MKIYDDKPTNKQPPKPVRYPLKDDGYIYAISTGGHMTEMFWYNYDTEEHDFIDTPEDYAPYIPKGAARSLFHLYVDKMDWAPIDAILEVLSVCCGDKAP